MGARSGFTALAVGLTLAVAGSAGMTRAAGWHRDEQGAKATALAQAFTAQADDPSAVYYNPAALAFAPDRAFSIGFGVTHASQASFHGADPFPGMTASGERRVDPEALPHVYWVEPVARRWFVGVSLQGAAGFETEWKQADAWSGRFIARRALLRSWEVGAVAAVRVGHAWGIAAGMIARRSELAWERSESVFDPSTQHDAEVGLSYLRSDGGSGVGVVVALAHRPAGRWSWGLRWRSAVSTDLEGEALYTQRPTGDPALDLLAAAALPFGSAVPWTARVRFPERFTVGVAYAPAPTVRLEVDLDYSEWSTLNAMVMRFSGQIVADRQPLSGWRARTATRVGLRWNGLGNGEWRAGLFHDPTPQPLADVGPFFVGAERLGASIGYGTRVRRLQTDLALVWEEHEKRMAVNGFDGNYHTRLLRMVLSFGW